MAFVKIQTLTPVHVGSGQIYSRNAEFIEENGQIGIVDANKVGKLIGDSRDSIDQWVRLIEDRKPLIQFLRENRGMRDISLYDISSRVIPLQGNGRQVNELRSQLHSALEGATLPGSSLKGAVRTALFNELIRENPTFARQLDLYKIPREKQGRREIDYKGNVLEAKYFGENPNHDIMRLFRPGDTYFDETVCIYAKTLNERGGGQEIKQEVTQLVECIGSDAVSVTKINLDENLLSLIRDYRYREFLNKFPNHAVVSSWETIMKRINDYTRQQVEQEIKRYQSEHLPGEASEYISVLKKLSESQGALRENECILRVGFGIGYLGMTGGWPLVHWKEIPGIHYEDEVDILSTAVRRTSRYNGLKLPKSRKLGPNGIPMGFVKLTLIGEEEYREFVRAKEVRKEAVLLKQKQQLEEVKRLRAQQEEEARLAAEEARKPKMFEGKLKQGSRLDAVVVKPGNPNLVRIYAPGYENSEIQMHRYRGTLSRDVVIEVTVNQLDKKGKVISVYFEKEKK